MELWWSLDDAELMAGAPAAGYGAEGDPELQPLSGVVSETVVLDEPPAVPHVEPKPFSAAGAGLMHLQMRRVQSARATYGY